MRFEALRPAVWVETIGETLDATLIEAQNHVTERVVDDASDGDDVAMRVVAKLRARAVVLAAEVERLQDTQRFHDTMVAFFIEKYHVKHLIHVLHGETTLNSNWEPDCGQVAQAKADAEQIIERLNK